MTKLRVGAAVFAALLLSGCAGPAADDADTTESDTPSATTTVESTPVSSESATPSATSTPTPTPMPTGRPALDELNLNSEGLQYVRVGQPVPKVPESEQIVRWKDNFCGFSGGDPKPGAYETLYPTVKNGNLAFYVETKTKKDGPVTAIYIISDKIHTAHGLHKGSSVADVKALGGVKEKGDLPGYQAWVIHGSAGELVFWADDKGVVDQLQVQEEGTKPALVFEITPCE